MFSVVPQAVNIPFMNNDIKNTGSFFCFEGIEGAGKSTLISLVSDQINSKGLETTITREPGGTSLGLKIRELLLYNSDIKIDSTAELLLFFADRVQHVKEVILPEITNGKVVLSDRFYYSTIAYQCFGRGLSRKIVDSLIQISLNSLKPHGVIILDLPVSVGLQRASKRAALDRFEVEKIDFHERIRNGFLELAKEDPERFLVLDATQTPDELTKQCVSFIEAKSTLSTEKRAHE